MANTVSLISYTNTFGDWVGATNSLIAENNSLARYNYTKDSGTLFLNDSGLGLQVANGAIVQGQLRVSGVGSSTYLQKNLSIDGQTYFQNTSLSFIASGQGEINGQLILRGSNNSIEVANNANISGSITVAGNSTTNGTSTIQGTLRVNGAANINNTLAVTGNATLKNSLVVTNDTQTKTLKVSETTTTDYLNVQQNIGSGGSAMVRYNVVTDKLQANTHVNTATLFVSGTTYSPFVRANTSVNTADVYITGTVETNNLTSNTSTIGTSKVINEDIYGQANINVIIANSATISVLNGVNSYYNIVRGNTYVSTNIVYANNITANAINASSNIITPLLTVTSRLDANSSNVFVNNLQTLGQLSVGGNFVINGTTVYNANTFVINAGSVSAQISKFSVNRGTGNANADIKWDEDNLVYKLNDVQNGQYYRILTDEYLSDSTSVTSSSNVASSKVANTLNTYITTANTYFTTVIASGNTWSQANVGSALADAKVYTDNANNAMASYVGDVVTSKVVPAYTRANTGLNLITGTSGSAIPAPTGSTTGVTLAGSNGVTAIATSNTITFSTPQDLRRTGSPIFTGMQLTTTPLSLSSGGTGASDRVTALTNLLPDASGVPAGYVLGTQGVGTYSWVAGGTGGGGGGTQPGSRITTTRSQATGDSSTKTFTVPTFVNGSNQLRVYIDGVRQYDGYTESGTTSVVFDLAPLSGSKILFEVDAYMIYAYYANNITITTPIGGIPSTANTIELALSSLETRKAALAGATFTGHATGLTVDSDASNTSFATTAFVKSIGYQLATDADTKYPLKAGTGASGTWSIGITGFAGSVGDVTESLSIPGKNASPGANKLVRTQDNGYTYVNYIVSDTNRSDNSDINQFITTNASDNYYRKANISVVRDAIQTTGINAVTFKSDRTNYKGVTDNAVTGEMMWKYGGSGYTIFDASAGTSPLKPNGTTASVDKTNSSVAWSANYPTLMGWNGANTYGIRVDSARRADSAVNADASNTATYLAGIQNYGGYAHLRNRSQLFFDNADNGKSMSISNQAASGSNYVQLLHWNTGSGTSTHTFYDNGNFTAGGNVTAYSDKRLKTNIETITNALDKTTKLRGVSFTMSGKEGIGVIAQEIQKILPEVVFENQDKDKTLSVAYGNIVGLLIESIKELKSEIDGLKSEIEEIKGKK
jgi:hypothetical protein